jgi:DNA-directed RNA polymerase alpha subunit
MVTDINKVKIEWIKDTKLKREIVKHLERMGITKVSEIEVMDDQELLIPNGLIPEELAELRKVIPLKCNGKSLGSDQLPVFSFKVREFLKKNNINGCSQLEVITNKELISRYHATPKIIKEIRMKFEEPHFYNSDEITKQGKIFLEDIDLTKRTYNALKVNEFKRFEDVAKLTIEELKALDRMGKGTIEEIIKVFGLKSSPKPRKKRGRKPKMIVKDELETLGLTTRTHNILKRFGCKTKEDVLKIPVEKLLAKKGLGLSAKKNLKESLVLTSNNRNFNNWD